MIDEIHLTGAHGQLNIHVIADNGDGTSLIEVRDYGIRARYGDQYTVRTEHIGRR